MAIQNIPAVAERIDLGDGDFITVRALTLGELAAVFDPVMRQVAAVFDRAVKGDPRAAVTADIAALCPRDRLIEGRAVCDWASDRRRLSA